MVSFPKLSLSKRSATVSDIDQQLSRLPLTLLPLTVKQEETSEVVADYDLSVLSLIPKDKVQELIDARIDTNIPSAHVFITYDDTKGMNKYIVTEPPLEKPSFDAYMKMIEILERKLLETGNEINMASVIMETVASIPSLLDKRDTTKTFLTTPGKVALYYLLRNVFGYNFITPLLVDPKIEDVSLNGINVPLFIYHRDFEYIPTNVILSKEMEVFGYKVDGSSMLDQLLLRFVYLTNKTISIANPIADGMLPAGDRLAATFRHEVSVKGSSMVIRKFAGRPITVLDLINSNVLSPEAAAYLWYAMDMRMSLMVMGVTGAGKTTILNAILNLVKETNKILSIEDVPELRLAHDNWIQLVSRPAFGDAGKEISLMDLVKLALRYRPDLIVVGEIRGAEAYVLFQAISTGHGGATTFHAYDVDSAVKRLINNPLNIPEQWVPMMNIGVVVRRLPIFTNDGVVLRRRTVSIEEIADYNDFRKVVTWEPKSDSFDVNLGNAKVLKSRLEESGKSLEEASEEVKRRAIYLKSLTKVPAIVQSPESYKELKKYIVKYSIKPEEALKEVSALVAR